MTRTESNDVNSSNSERNRIYARSQTSTPGSFLQVGRPLPEGAYHRDHASLRGTPPESYRVGAASPSPSRERSRFRERREEVAWFESPRPSPSTERSARSDYFGLSVAQQTRERLQAQREERNRRFDALYNTRFSENLYTETQRSSSPRGRSPGERYSTFYRPDAISPPGRPDASTFYDSASYHQNSSSTRAEFHERARLASASRERQERLNTRQLPRSPIIERNERIDVFWAAEHQDSQVGAVSSSVEGGPRKLSTPQKNSSPKHPSAEQIDATHHTSASSTIGLEPSSSPRRREPRVGPVLSEATSVKPDSVIDPSASSNDADINKSTLTLPVEQASASGAIYISSDPPARQQGVQASKSAVGESDAPEVARREDLAELGDGVSRKGQTDTTQVPQSTLPATSDLPLPSKLSEIKGDEPDPLMAGDSYRNVRAERVGPALEEATQGPIANQSQNSEGSGPLSFFAPSRAEAGKKEETGDSSGAVAVSEPIAGPAKEISFSTERAANEHATRPERVGPTLGAPQDTPISSPIASAPPFTKRVERVGPVLSEPKEMPPSSPAGTSKRPERLGATLDDAPKVATAEPAGLERHAPRTGETPQLMSVEQRSGISIMGVPRSTQRMLSISLLPAEPPIDDLPHPQAMRAERVGPSLTEESLTGSPASSVVAPATKARKERVGASLDEIPRDLTPASQAIGTIGTPEKIPEKTLLRPAQMSEETLLVGQGLSNAASNFIPRTPRVGPVVEEPSRVRPDSPVLPPSERDVLPPLATPYYSSEPAGREPQLAPERTFSEGLGAVPKESASLNFAKITDARPSPKQTFIPPQSDTSQVLVAGQASSVARPERVGPSLLEGNLPFFARTRLGDPFAQKGSLSAAVDKPLATTSMQQRLPSPPLPAPDLQDTWPGAQQHGQPNLRPGPQPSNARREIFNASDENGARSAPATTARPEAQSPKAMDTNATRPLPHHGTSRALHPQERAHQILQTRLEWYDDLGVRRPRRTVRALPLWHAGPFCIPGNRQSMAAITRSYEDWGMRRISAEGRPLLFGPKRILEDARYDSAQDPLGRGFRTNAALPFRPSSAQEVGVNLSQADRLPIYGPKSWSVVFNDLTNPKEHHHHCFSRAFTRLDVPNINQSQLRTCGDELIDEIVRFLAEIGPEYPNKRVKVRLTHPARDESTVHTQPVSVVPATFLALKVLLDGNREMFERMVMAAPIPICHDLAQLAHPFIFQPETTFLLIGALAARMFGVAPDAHREQVFYAHAITDVLLGWFRADRRDEESRVPQDSSRTLQAAGRSATRYSRFVEGDLGLTSLGSRFGLLSKETHDRYNKADQDVWCHLAHSEFLVPLLGASLQRALQQASREESDRSSFDPTMATQKLYAFLEFRDSIATVVDLLRDAENNPQPVHHWAKQALRGATQLAQRNFLNPTRSTTWRDQELVTEIRPNLSSTPMAYGVMSSARLLNFEHSVRDLEQSRREYGRYSGGSRLNPQNLFTLGDVRARYVRDMRQNASRR